MLKIKEALVVEGKYDKNTLAQIVDAPIFVTDGFGIFKNPEQLALLRAAAKQRGLIVLTDSDGAGFLIRNHLKGAIDPALVKHAYIPDIYGKEKRKSAPGKEGKLGVEGMDAETLLTALRNAGATVLEAQAPASTAEREPITKTELYELGLTGKADSQARRLALQKRLGLPEHMSTNALLTALNCVVTREELYALEGHERLL
ncbi:MAG: DUF4093 domain-containing protein [Oscillospiraceae bacterium]|nr:DUF4093 domain-containing protein [Oscillospiraceae bacterium]